ncbi:HK97 gp10 family phage protein [Bartonella sp. HY038]|uniref:HK97 gp10 family phage protein n=1 Tax=Bartonella sp. HY038 TaxID=2759660 RepID=UPI0015FC6AA3|nr:HK97 gp10 family phage protein [Bartonella sp. HY038]
MQKSFTAQIDNWVLQTRARMLAVFQLSAQYVIEDIQERTPVDTGFLRASMIVSNTELSPIKSNSRPPSSAEKDSYSPPVYALTIANAPLGSTIYASFTASYAAHVEFGAKGRQGVGMVRLAAQNWNMQVQRATKEAKASVKK